MARDMFSSMIRQLVMLSYIGTIGIRIYSPLKYPHIFQNNRSIANSRGTMEADVYERINCKTTLGVIHAFV